LLLLLLLLLVLHHLNLLLHRDVHPPRLSIRSYLRQLRWIDTLRIGHRNWYTMLGLLGLLCLQHLLPLSCHNVLVLSRLWVHSEIHLRVVLLKHCLLRRP
jgi:hypothetical protein